jgi:AraC-like DNA-binding protein
MTNRAYYRLPEQLPCDIRSCERPVLINCAGSVSIDSPFTTDNRKGRRDYYLMVVLTGSMDALVNGESGRITAGDAVLFPPRKPYRYTGAEKVEYYWAHFTGSDAEGTLRACGLSETGVFRTGESEAVIQAFKLIFEDFIRRDAVYQLSAAAHLTAALIEIGRRALASGQPGADARIGASIRYIHHHFNLPVKIPELAAMEFLSVPQYTLLFRRCTGKSPLSYMIGLRVESACEMLLNTDLSIRQIARIVGYEDPQYFSRIFKVYRGVSPDGYRRLR